MGEPVPFTKPIGDSVPKVDNSIAVGEDLEFQRSWWRFERITWIVFGCIILCDVLGLFGRGYLANAKAETSRGDLQLKYERIERASTPSIMTFRYSADAVHDGKIQVYVSESVVKGLGAQRISPQPLSSVLGSDGITYTFPATDGTGLVQIALEPSFPGVHRFLVGLAGEDPISARVVVVP